jgi:hypothetical protein
MIVELTNHNIEMSTQYEVERIDENRYGGILYFQFYYGNRRWSKEYREPTYTYRVIDDRR